MLITVFFKTTNQLYRFRASNLKFKFIIRHNWISIFFSTLNIFRFILKIFESINFFKWKRKIYEMLKWIFFWKYVESFNEIILRQSASFASNKKIFDFYMTWWKNDNHCRTALRSCVKKKIYNDIVECVTVKLVWNKIKQICEFKNFNAFLITYVKYENFKCANCESLFQYDVKFRKIVNELIIYFEKIRLKFNWLIFKYFVDLSKSIVFFIDRWIFEHDFINNEIEIEYDVVTFMHVYEAQYVNFVDFFVHNDIDVAFLSLI